MYIDLYTLVSQFQFYLVNGPKNCCIYGSIKLVGTTSYTVAAIIIEIHLPVPLPVPVQLFPDNYGFCMTCPYGSHSYLEIPGLELEVELADVFQ